MANYLEDEVEVSLWDFVDPAQEHADFEAGAEDGEKAAMRREAEEEARKEAAMEAARPSFKAAMEMAKKALAEGYPGVAQGIAWEAQFEANTPGQKRLAAALLRTADRAVANAKSVALQDENL